jgi:hypothetical protein
MVVYQKWVFPIVEISICGPRTYNFQFSQELSFLSIVLCFKVQTLRAIFERSVEIVQRGKCKRKHIKAEIFAVETNSQLLFDIQPYGKLQTRFS